MSGITFPIRCMGDGIPFLLSAIPFRCVTYAGDLFPMRLMNPSCLPCCAFIVIPKKFSPYIHHECFAHFFCCSIKEMSTFFSKTIVKRTQPGQRQSVQHEGEKAEEDSRGTCRNTGAPPVVLGFQFRDFFRVTSLLRYLVRTRRRERATCCDL